MNLNHKKNNELQFSFFLINHAKQKSKLINDDQRKISFELITLPVEEEENT